MYTLWNSFGGQTYLFELKKWKFFVVFEKNKNDVKTKLTDEKLCYLTNDWSIHTLKIISLKMDCI